MSLNTQTYKLPEGLQNELEASIADWHDSGKVERLWAKDPAVWTNKDEAKWLGWLDIVERQHADQQKFVDFQREVKAEEFSHILLLGMGGSSLCPEVLSFTFGKQTRTAYSGFDRPGANSGGRIQDRPCKDFVFRFEQIRHDLGT